MEILLVPKRSSRYPASGDNSASTASTTEKIPAVAPRLQPKVSSKATLKTPKDEFSPREKPRTTKAMAATSQGVGEKRMTKLSVVFNRAAVYAQANPAVRCLYAQWAVL